MCKHCGGKRTPGEYRFKCLVCGMTFIIKSDEPLRRIHSKFYLGSVLDAPVRHCAGGLEIVEARPQQVKKT